jgi:toxin ParE1/3/4
MSYRLSPAARADLRAIWPYSLDIWGRAQADRYILSIEKVFASLSSGTERGRPADHFRKGYRMASVGFHYIFYGAPYVDGVEIMRVPHQRMNIRSRLFENRR